MRPAPCPLLLAAAVLLMPGVSPGGVYTAVVSVPAQPHWHTPAIAVYAPRARSLGIELTARHLRVSPLGGLEQRLPVGARAAGDFIEIWWLSPPADDDSPSQSYRLTITEESLVPLALDPGLPSLFHGGDFESDEIDADTGPWAQLPGHRVESNPANGKFCWAMNMHHNRPGPRTELRSPGPLRVEKGGWYAASFSVRCRHVIAGERLECRLTWLDVHQRPLTTTVRVVSLQGDSDWRPVSFLERAPRHAGWLQVAIANFSTAGAIWVDDFRVQPWPLPELAEVVDADGLRRSLLPADAMRFDFGPVDQASAPGWRSVSPHGLPPQLSVAPTAVTACELDGVDPVSRDGLVSSAPISVQIQSPHATHTTVWTLRRRGATVSANGVPLHHETPASSVHRRQEAAADRVRLVWSGDFPNPRGEVEVVVHGAPLCGIELGDKDGTERVRLLRWLDAQEVGHCEVAPGSAALARVCLARNGTAVIPLSDVAEPVSAPSGMTCRVAPLTSSQRMAFQCAGSMTVVAAPPGVAPSSVFVIGSRREAAAYAILRADGVAPGDYRCSLAAHGKSAVQVSVLDITLPQLADRPPWRPGRPSFDPSPSARQTILQPWAEGLLAWAGLVNPMTDGLSWEALGWRSLGPLPAYQQADINASAIHAAEDARFLAALDAVRSAEGDSLRRELTRDISAWWAAQDHLTSPVGLADAIRFSNNVRRAIADVAGARAGK